MATPEEFMERVGDIKDKLGISRQPHIPQVQERSLAKGMLAGLVGGIVATAAKSFGERVFPPRTHGEPEPPSVLAEKLAGHALSPAQDQAASQAIHWTFGALTGAAYGGLAEYFPQATQREGASFGLALATLTHGHALPAFGLAADPEHQTTREHTSEMATHILYGVITEVVRSAIRRQMD